ncbi:MAG: TIGR03016 family PEP-CTERM system-associated outer membrane protein [Nitrososphaera sp.]|nr:TIGR03016 family PEP-CTERM system-associated outer membrane protein [Nitrososphaera sp.]
MEELPCYSPVIGDYLSSRRGPGERVGIIVANMILLVLNCPVALAQGPQPEARATQDIVGPQRRLRDATPRRLTAPVAFDFSDQLAYADAAYTIRPGWTITPDFKLGEIYTDNIALTSSETQDDFVTELKPGIQVLGNTRRLVFELNYNLQHLVYAGNPEFDDTFHRLFSSVNTELVEQLIFLDADTTLTQQNLTTTGRGAFSNFGPAATLNDIDDNINVTGDREDVTTYRIAPYLRRRFGNFASAEVRFTYDDVSASETNADIDQFNDGGSSDSRSSNYRADVRSGSRYLAFPWALSYENRQIDFDTGETTEFEQIIGHLEYVYSPSIRLLGDLGYEKNSFESSDAIDNTIIWNIGGRWTPSARTTLEATYGKRFLGKQYAVNLSHQTKRMTWLFRYDEEQETVRDRQIERAVRSRGINISPIDPETGDPVLPDGGIPTQTNEVFVRRLLSSGVVYQTDRNQITLSVFDENRDFQSSGGSQSLFGATAIWTRRMSPLTNLDASFGWTTTDGAQGLTTTTGSEDLINLRVQLQHWLGHSFLATIGYRRIELSSDDVESEFTENRIFGNLRMTF